MSEYKTDCYFFHIEHDMGASVPFCLYDCKGEFNRSNTINACPKDCRKYIPNNKVNEIIKGYVENSACDDCYVKSGIDALSEE